MWRHLPCLGCSSSVLSAVADSQLICPSCNECQMSTYLVPADSMYGHVAKLAEKVKAGLDSVPGIKATIYRVRQLCFELIRQDQLYLPINPLEAAALTASLSLIQVPETLPQDVLTKVSLIF